MSPELIEKLWTALATAITVGGIPLAAVWFVLKLWTGHSEQPKAKMPRRPSRRPKRSRAFQDAQDLASSGPHRIIRASIAVSIMACASARPEPAPRPDLRICPVDSGDWVNGAKGAPEWRCR